MRLVTTDIQARYRVVKPFRLPFHAGSMLRGILGRALHRAACLRPMDACASHCELPLACVYSRLFEPPVPLPLPHPFLRGQTRAPQPLIPVFPTPRRADLQNGDEFPITLRILGPLQNDDLTIVRKTLAGIAAFPLANEQGRVELLETTIVGSPETPIPIDVPPNNVARLEIHFMTPTQIEIDKMLMIQLEFSPFFRNVYRRITELVALYGEGLDEINADFRRLDALAQHIGVAHRHLESVHFERQSVARDRKHPMRGLLGHAIFTGPNLDAFVPLFRVAEKTHIGKATSFGLGRILVNSLP